MKMMRRMRKNKQQVIKRMHLWMLMRMRLLKIRMHLSEVHLESREMLLQISLRIRRMHLLKMQKKMVFQLLKMKMEMMLS